MEQLTFKTSTVFIVKDGATRVYRSMDDVPVELRRELEETTDGFNSATILIADRRGREEIVRALQGLPTILRTRIEATLEPAGSITEDELEMAAAELDLAPRDAGLSMLLLPDAARLRWRMMVRYLRHNWYGVALVVGTAAVLAAALGLR